MSNEQTDNRVINVDNFDNRYNELKKLQDHIIQKEQEHIFVDMITKELQNIMEQTYSNRKSLNSEIKYPITFFPSPKDHFLINLIRMQTHPDNSLYNSVLSPVITNLSKKCRIGIPRQYDALQSIELSCINPVSDIESITLYAGIGLPIKYNNEDKLNWTRKMISEDLCEYPNEFYSQESCKYFYIPVKTITNIESNLINFFDTPILLCRSFFISYSIQVNYTNNIKSHVHDFPIKLNYLLFEQTFRNKVSKDKQLGYNI